MLNEKDSKRLSFIIKILYIVTIAALIFFAGKYIFPIILPFIIAFGLCYIMEPFVKLMERKLKLKRTLACGISTVLLLIIIAGILFLLSVTVVKELRDLSASIPSLLKQIPQYLDNFSFKYEEILQMIPDEFVDSVKNFIENFDYSSLITGPLGKNLLGYATSFVASLPSMLIFLLVTIVSTFFMSVSFLQVRQFILAQFSPTHRTWLLEAKRNLFITVGRYGKAYAVLLSLTFVELSIFFTIFQIKPAITLAFIIALVDILPVLGVGTVLLPWSLIELIMGDPWRALILLCIYIVVTIVRQIAEPKVIGDSVGLMPIATLFCIYVGFQLFGIGGMFLTPITVIIIKNMQDDGRFKIWKYHDNSIDK